MCIRDSFSVSIDRFFRTSAKKADLLPGVDQVGIRDTVVLRNTLPVVRADLREPVAWLFLHRVQRQEGGAGLSPTGAISIAGDDCQVACSHRAALDQSGQRRFYLRTKAGPLAGDRGLFAGKRGEPKWVTQRL